MVEQRLVTLERDSDLLTISDNLEKYGQAFPSEIFQRLVGKLKRCGQWGKYNFYCKECNEKGRYEPLKSVLAQLFCEIRYCWNPDCVVERFARTLDEFRNIERLKPLRGLWHFVIGFPSISLDDFNSNFLEIKKKYEYTLNQFWSKLKKAGIPIPAIRVLDFSFEKDNKVYIHYHFGAIPVSGLTITSFMNKVHLIRKDMLRKSRRLSSFAFRSFGVKSKGAIFSYLAKRSAGIYKHGEGKNLKWSTGKGKLKKDLIAGKYFGLESFLTLDQYIKHFYKKKHYLTVGGLPRLHSCIPTDIIKSVMPTYCPFCQKELTRDDLFIDIEVGVPPPPHFCH